MRNPLARIAFALLALVASQGTAATFTVNDTGNAGDHTLGDGVCEIAPIGSGQCTLRAAIQEANQTTAADTIEFAIPAGMCPTDQVCVLTNPQLPTIQRQVTIDGYTQTGAAPNSAPTTRVTNAQIKVSIENGGSGCLTISHLTAPADETEGTVIRGLSLAGCTGAAISMSSPYNTIQGNFIGTTVDGSAVASNDNGGDGVFASFSGDPAGNNLIGGFLPSEWNLISGNGGDGVDLSSDGNLVLGNLIGTDSLGIADLGNFNDGIEVSRDGNQIGMDIPLVGRDLPAPLIMGNLIGGNRQHGVEITGTADDNWLGGNVIGADTTQLSAIANDLDGVRIAGTGNRVGTEAVGAANVISGNGDHGVFISGSGANDNTVAGNFIGITFDVTNLSLYQALGNGCDGVRISTNGNTIGGALLPGQGNYIGGNVGCGLANGDGHGIELTANASDNELLGNWIGLDPNGLPRPNAADGVSMANNSQRNRIGDGSDFGANLFGPNGPGADDLAIDLDNDGPDVNDAMDPDAGSGHPNDRQNYPVVTSAINGPTGTVISGTLNSNPGMAFLIQTFSSPAGESGQARAYAGSVVTAATNGAGDTSWQLTVSPAIAVGSLITATATPDLSGAAPTSELSAAVVVTQPAYSSVPGPGNTIALGSAVVGTPTSAAFAVSEAGDATLVVSSPMISGGDAADFSVTSPSFPFQIPDGGANVIVTVQCVPGAQGARSSTLQLTTNDPLQPTVSYGITCTGLAPPAPGYGSAPLPGSTLSAGSAVVGNPTATQLMVMETGDAALVVSSPAISGANAGDFSVTSPAFPFTIADGAGAVAVTVECVPSAQGARSATLELTTNDPSQPAVSYSLSCTGTAAPAAGYGSAPPPGTPLLLGSANVGSPTSAQLMVMETGDAALLVSSPAISGGDAGDFSVTSPAFPFTIADGAGAVAVTVECVPSAAGARSATLELTTNDPSQPTVSYPLACTGIAVPTPGYGSTPAPGGALSSGSTPVGIAAVTTLTVAETGDATLLVSNPTISGGDAGDFAVTSPAFPITLMDGAPSVAVTVECVPSATGARASTLQLSTNDPSQPTVSYPLGCTGTAPATPGFDPTPVPPGPIVLPQTAVGSQSTQTVFVDESGSADLVLSNPAFGGPGAASFQTSTPFPVTIPDGGPGQNVVLVCAPAVAGQHTATFTVTTNDPANTTVTYDLSCQAVDGPVVAIPTQSPWGLALLGVLLACAALVVLRAPVVSR